LFYLQQSPPDNNDMSVRILMNLTTLTHPSAVCVQAQYASRDEAIRQLAMRLVALGKITDSDAFLTEVFYRETQGPTALGEGLAVPHGKSAAVKEAAFAVATLREPLAWKVWMVQKRLS